MQSAKAIQLIIKERQPFSKNFQESGFILYVLSRERLWNDSRYMLLSNYSFFCDLTHNFLYFDKIVTCDQKYFFMRSPSQTKKK